MSLETLWIPIVVTSSSTIEKHHLEFYCQLTAPSVYALRGVGMVEEPFAKKKFFTN
jgi:hypothetical protein